MSKTKIELLESRLEAWDYELQTDQFGMAEYAERAVKILKADIRRQKHKALGRDSEVSDG